jgi:hypothetical protein
MMGRNMVNDSDNAMDFSLRALAWLAGNDDLFPTFLGTTGASVEDARNNAADLNFLASVLDFILMDDAWVIACCDALGRPYADLGQMRQHLPGGDLPNWT